MKLLAVIASVFFGANAFAGSVLEGIWENYERTARAQFIEFDGKLTMNTRSYYSNGAPSDYFFEFNLPKHREVQPGEVLEGRVRSIDGYYGCLFDEPAKAQLAHDGTLKLNYPLLTFTRETRSVRDSVGRHYERIVDWNGWGWVERIHSYPVERWRVISNECVIKGRNWVTNLLYRYEVTPPVEVTPPPTSPRPN